MKKLLTICLFMAITFTVNAQEKKALTFDETVMYIKDNLVKKARYSQDLVYIASSSFTTIMMHEASISSAGQVTLAWGKLYNPITFNLNKILKIENQEEEIRFFTTNNSYYLLTAETQIDAERLTKAFNHLKSLLPKEKDPFSN